ncbi:MAG TPA: GNAT family N-acetyltransferase [Flavobacterium sp.]|nr:GNAT family N-acetyltransferase [Flavobacterium sp.]
MIEIKKIYKKDIPGLLSNVEFWKNSFLAISRHRLHAHLKNPTSDDTDVVLLLAYLNQELVGYMGVYIDKIILDGAETKIGWLSTWWVHPKTKGSGIGREILNTMYEANNGKIGISQFTPSAKRVYDKSGYFATLKKSVGIKGILKSHTAYLIPQLYPKMNFLKPGFALLDFLINALVSVKLLFLEQVIKKRLQNIKVDYLTTPDAETIEIIKAHNSHHISEKSPDFFEWLKACHWVEEAPLLEFTDKSKYEFSMYDKSFAIYLVKVTENNRCIGFFVLQKRNVMVKLLFAYYDGKDSEKITDIIKLQCLAQNTREIICYDPKICAVLKKSHIFLYRRKKVKESIISKAFGKIDFEDVIVNFGDGDCSFA